MPDTYLFTLSKNVLPLNGGGKAAQIQRLISNNLTVPVTHVCIWDAYEAYLENGLEILNDLKQEIAQKLDLSKAYAVRSSANIEDGQKYSFAGQFDSVLDVRGLDNILDAVQVVWNSAQNPKVRSYLAESDLSFDQLRMAVILQEMVNPAVSGVAFSKNPITGLDEIVVEAVNGFGDALVQSGATPERWIYKWGAWITRPVQSGIDETIIDQVVAATRSIAETLDRPLDLEWVYSGSAVHWVQLREITALDNINIYSNRISREVLPGIIKPLVWSINVPLVNSAWIDIFTELIGANDIVPDDLSKAFYYRAYFNMGVIGRVFSELGMPKGTLEIMMGLEGGDEAPTFRPSNKVLRHVPRMLKFSLAKLRYGREIEAFLPEMDRTYAAFKSKSIAEMTEPELLATLDQLIAFNRKAAYMNIIGPLLMLLYNGMFRRSLSRTGLTYEDFDITYNLAELEQYDPGGQLQELRRAFGRLDPALQERIRNGSYDDLRAAADVPESFRRATAEFVNQFGHLSDSGNDFSRVPWRENPDLVLNMIVNWEGKTAQDGRVQSKENAAVQDRKMTNWETAPLSRSDRWRMQWQYHRARRFRLYREAISFRYTYGYGLIRNYVLALGDHLVERNVLAKRDDVFFLYLHELRAASDLKTTKDWAELVEARKEEISQVEDIVLPEIIYGDAVPPPELLDAGKTRLMGIPTSGGYFRGRVTVVKNLEEFDKMRVGSVLVIPYSDVSWTPLFAKAGAVIAESGGILSHSSIVARELMLPAVVSVPAACHALKDGMMVHVDGYKGEILIG